MEGLNSRQKKLISLLVQNSDFLPVTFYAEKLGKTNRTLYSDLQKIENHLGEAAKVGVEKKPRIGIRLTGSPEAKMELLESLGEEISKPVYSATERRYQIAKLLLVDNETVTQQRLSQLFHVSHSSIANDLEKIEERYIAKVVSSKQGTKICGSEEEIQRSLFRFCQDYLEYRNINDDSYFRIEGKQVLSEIFGAEIVEEIFRQVQGLKNHVNFSLLEQYEKSITLSLIIFCSCLAKGKHVEEKEFLFDQIQMIDTYLLANELLEKISQRLNFSYQEEDVAYVNRSLAGYGIKVRDQDTHPKVEFSETIQKILKNMSEIMQVDFLQDEELLERFARHFIPMVYRLKMGIEITNPLVEEIKSQYAITFNSTWYALANVEDELDIHFNDEEVAFLAMYFQVSLEKTQHGKKILIVCPSGVGTSELILNKIHRILPAQDSAEVTTINALYKKNLENVDLIISSVNLKDVDKPIIKVSPLVTAQDIKNISNLYLDYFYQEEESEVITFHDLKRVIDLDFIDTGRTFANKEECLNWMINRLEKKKIVTKSFRKEVFDREKLGETALETGVAIPHAAPQHVLETKVFILSLARPIVWDQRKVSYVLLMCIAESERKLLRGIMTDIYKVVHSEANVKKIFEKKDAYEVYQEIKK